MRKYNKDIYNRQSDGQLGSILQNVVVITRSVKSPDLLTPPKCQSGFKHEWGAVFRKPQAKVKISQFPSCCDKHSTVQPEQPKGFLSAYHSRPHPRPEGSQSRDTRQAFLLSHTGTHFPTQSTQKPRADAASGWLTGSQPTFLPAWGWCPRHMRDCHPSFGSHSPKVCNVI